MRRMPIEEVTGLQDVPWLIAETADGNDGGGPARI